MREYIKIVESPFLGEPDPYEAFVREGGQKLNQMVWEQARLLMEEARSRGIGPTEGNFKMPDESDFIYALIEELQEAGFKS